MRIRPQRAGRSGSGLPIAFWRQAEFGHRTAPPNTNPAGDPLPPAYSGSAPLAPADTDDREVPDLEEAARGLDLYVGNTNDVGNTNAGTLSPAGYTDLGVYLQEPSASRIGGTAV